MEPEPEPMNVTECSRWVPGPGRSVETWSSERTPQVTRTRAQNSRMSWRTARLEISGCFYIKVRKGVQPYKGAKFVIESGCYAPEISQGLQNAWSVLFG